ncbi:hypothetical protein [Pseudoalteromonas denitrificans]|uniref:Uncharacterized protein n=1 Tax=Pseudoalteromonas denitrificans DSM 6059 TaxID=1123010 RepID=A0A1I1TRX9_9GAMM|nr:hypothetical protein [Pseudoalteromonas denitrificans]SFD59988.1 hypothetical protein SAMN02745724_04935 [Pseudoalteromonas denitrificans DSM 6059]
MNKFITGLLKTGIIGLAFSSINTYAEETWVERIVCDYSTEVIHTPAVQCRYAGDLTTFNEGIYKSLTTTHYKIIDEGLMCPEEFHLQTHRLEGSPATMLVFTGTLTLNFQGNAGRIETITEKVADSCRLENVLIPSDPGPFIPTL